MPQVQVIKREADPLAQQISNAGTGIADVILKKQAMQLTAMELKQKAAAAQDEGKKLEWDRASKLTEQFIALKDKYPNEMAMKMMSSVYGPDVWKLMNVAGQTYNNIYSSMKEQPESAAYQKTMGEVAESEQETGMKSRINAMLDGQAQEGATAGGGMSGSGMGAARGMVLSGMTGTSPQWKNIGAEQDLIVAQERAKSMVRAEPFMKQYKVMKSQFMDALKELPPISDKPGQAKIDGFINGIKAEYGSKAMPAVQSVNRSLDGIALTVANIANGGGRATSDQDRKAIRETLPDFGMPTATMERLFEYIEAGFPVLNGYTELPDKDRTSQLKSFMQNAVTTVVENDRRTAAKMKAKFPQATEEEINEALRTIHAEEGAY